MGEDRVVISEIMYNPDGSDTSREWVELYNAGTHAVDLAGWRIEDVQDGQASAPLASTLLQPGAALVVTADAELFDAQWNATGQTPRLEVADYPTFANSPSPSNETIALRNASGVLVDQINYDDTGDWPRDSPDGASIALLPGSLSSAANDSGSAWKTSMVGLYGARFEFGPQGQQDRASPGVVVTVPQRPFTPSPDAAWSMVVLPDTQAYAKSSTDTAILRQMTQWVVDHRDPFGVQFVLHEGDVVNQNSQVDPTSGDQSGDQQWQNAKAAMSLLDGVVPYAIAPGNHDYGATNAQDRSTQYNDYFAQDDNPLVDPQRDGTLRSVMTPGELDNSLHEFVAPDGREMLVVTTEWGPRQDAVDWANRALRPAQYADHTAVLLTHAYMHHDETRYDWERNLDSDPDNNQGGNPHSYPTAGDTHDGEDLWNELVRPNGAFEMVLSGHVGGDGTAYLASEGDRGQTVHQMLFNTQFETFGGNGWLRVLEFLDDGRTVRVRTYSPFHDLEKTDAANAFDFTISPRLPGDYNDDGRVDAADYSLWRDRTGTNVPAWSSADGDGDGFVDAGDYEDWRNAYGATRQAPSSRAIPEPAGGVVALLIVIGSVWSRTTSRR
ncbi:hypothetical protein MalM25_11770 [Planctomycetes bacterium MalM25]|nr:hypothetical protein MalM25_11770 [Planctomycetes bacterium MalM25]